jgi:hypothetical protein
MNNKIEKIIAGGYTYEVGNYKVRKGSVVILPTAEWLRDVKGDTWEATVEATESDYEGNLVKIVGVKEY